MSVKPNFEFVTKFGGTVVKSTVVRLSSVNYYQTCIKVLIRHFATKAIKEMARYCPTPNGIPAALINHPTTS